MGDKEIAEKVRQEKTKMVRIGLYIEADVECQHMTQITEYVYIYNTSWLGFEIIRTLHGKFSLFWVS